MRDDVELGMPRRVLSLAVTMGAHGDCLVADYDTCCSACKDMLNTAFDLSYNPGGLRPLGEVLDDLWDDMFGDRAVA